MFLDENLDLPMLHKTASCHYNDGPIGRDTGPFY